MDTFVSASVVSLFGVSMAASIRCWWLERRLEKFYAALTHGNVLLEDLKKENERLEKANYRLRGENDELKQRPEPELLRGVVRNVAEALVNYDRSNKCIAVDTIEALRASLEELGTG